MTSRQEALDALCEAEAVLFDATVGMLRTMQDELGFQTWEAAEAWLRQFDDMTPDDVEFLRLAWEMGL